MRKAIGIGIAMLAIAVSASIADAKEWKTVRVGLEGVYPPFNFYDSDKNLTGFDYDIAVALCAKMAVECTFTTQDWDGIIPALLAGKFDAIISSMSITEERMKQVDFTDPYYTNALVFIAPKDTDITDVSPAGLAGKTLGVQSSTISSGFLEDNYPDATIKQYPTVDESFLDLASGRADAVLGDFGVSYLWLHSDDGKCCDFVGDAVLKDDHIGMAVRKEDGDLRDMLNTALKEIVADGTYKKVNDKYFPFSIY